MIMDEQKSKEAVMKKRFPATNSAVLDKRKTKSLLGIVLLFSWLIAAISPVYSQEVSNGKLFLKSGRVIVSEWGSNLHNSQINK